MKANQEVYAFIKPYPPYNVEKSVKVLLTDIGGEEIPYLLPDAVVTTARARARDGHWKLNKYLRGMPIEERKKKPSRLFLINSLMKDGNWNLETLFLSEHRFNELQNRHFIRNIFENINVI